jgi:integrase
MAKFIEAVERGIFRRKDPKTGALLAPLWILYRKHGKPVQESTKQTSVAVARTLLAQRVAAVSTGATIPSGSLTVDEMLARYLADQERNARAQLRTVRGHVAVIAKLIGTRRAREITTADIERLQDGWLGTITNATINRRCEVLRCAFSLAVRRGDLAGRPYVPRLVHHAERGKYIPPSERVILAEHLPDYVAPFLEFASLYGIRRGQLSITEKTWVDLERGTITWPPTATKPRELHSIPIEGTGRAIVERLLADGEKRPWCKYLFHGKRCAPGRRGVRRYGCIGDFKKAWNAACKAAGLPVGRKAGGFVFHHTRNTAVTDMLASGVLSTADAMAISNHKTESMVKHYNLGNIEGLRERLAAARVEVERLQEKATR